MARDHDDIAKFISDELERRKGTEWRRKHEERWKEVDRQIAMDPPLAYDADGNPKEPGTWHNAIQLGDLTDASETLTADTMRLSMPTDRRWFVPHVELPFDVDDNGDPVPVPPERQREANGVTRNLMVQQHKDFGVRGRIKLGVKEILHHGSVVATVEEEKIRKFSAGGTSPEHLKAPVPVIHSMWNCYPDSSPRIQGTEIFYSGSMIITRFVALKDALEMPGWINKDKLQLQNKNRDLDEHIEIGDYYGDVFLRRHDGNVLFPNRKTTVSGTVFLASEVYKTSYSPVIYTGYERDDVRDPYYTSPIVKRAPMGKFVTHMTNRTMDAVDLAVDPPIAYDSLDNSLKGDGPQLFPGAKIPVRGGSRNINKLDVGDAATGLAAMQFGKQDMQEGTTVDSVRKGVAPGTEQTATEIVKTEQRAEVREVEFVANVDNELLLPYLIMQHDLNLQGLEPYPFFNDEIHTPDFLRATKKDLPKNVIMEVTGSRQLLGEEQRTARFINTAATAANVQPLAQTTDWQEVARQMWEDTRVKDPERFLVASDRNAEVQEALQAQQEQFEQALQQVQQALQQAQQQAQQAQDAQRQAEVRAQEASLQNERQKLQEQQLRLENATLQQQLKLAQELERAETRLQKLRQDIQLREERQKCEREEGGERRERDDRILQLAERLTQ